MDRIIKAALAVSWLRLVSSVSLVLVAAVVIFTYFVGKSWRLDTFFFGFNLNSETNFAAWWSSALLLTCSLLCYEFFSRRSRDLRAPWLLLALIFLIMSWDEIGSLHERNLDFSGPKLVALLAVGALMAAAILYSVCRLIARAETRTTGWLLVLVFFLYATVPLQEFVEFRVDWPFWLKGLRAGVEEGTEILATILALCAIAMQRRPKHDGSLLQVIPDPSALSSLRPVLLVLLVLHSIVCLFYVPTLDMPRYDEILGVHGNPGAWFPAAVYLLLACHSVRALPGAKQGGAGWRGGLALFFLVCSAFTVLRLEAWWPGMAIVRRLPMDVSMVYVYQFAFMGVFLARLNRLNRRTLPMYFLAAALPLFMQSGSGPGVILVVQGVLAYLYAEMFYLAGQADEVSGAVRADARGRTVGSGA